MLKKYHDELICDFAETYRIYDIRSFDAGYIATLAAGLRADSRIARELSGVPCTVSEELAAMAVDRLSLILYVLSAKKGQPKPASVADALVGKQEKDDRKYMAFSSPEEFEKIWKTTAAGGK